MALKSLKPFQTFPKQGDAGKEEGHFPSTALSGWGDKGRTRHCAILRGGVVFILMNMRIKRQSSGGCCSCQLVGSTGISSVPLMRGKGAPCPSYTSQGKGASLYGSVQQQEKAGREGHPSDAISSHQHCCTGDFTP